jgi:hypothetical protein
MSRKIITSQMYLDMWLSEQIPPLEWLIILEERKDVKILYHEHLEKMNGLNEVSSGTDN